MPELVSPRARLAGRRADFDAVFAEAYPRLVRSVAVACGDPELAADCVADAFERAFVRWWRIGRYDDPVGWIRRVALNRAVDAHRRSERHRRVVDATDAAVLVVPGVDETVRLGDPALVAALGSLSERQRTVALAHYVEERTVAEIAASLKITDGAVKYHLHAARHRLRQELSGTPDHDDDEEAP